MTKAETAKLILILESNFNEQKTTPEVKEARTNLWYKMFCDEPYEVVATAVIAYIASAEDRWFPTVGTIKTKLYEMRSGNKITGMEAWGILVRAIQNSAYHAKEEFEKLPDDIKKVIHSSETLREYGMMNPEQVNTVIQSNFIKSYIVQAKHSEENAVIPDCIRRLMVKNGLIEQGTGQYGGIEK